MLTVAAGSLQASIYKQIGRDGLKIAGCGGRDNSTLPGLEILGLRQDGDGIIFFMPYRKIYKLLAWKTFPIGLRWQLLLHFTGKSYGVAVMRGEVSV